MESPFLSETKLSSGGVKEGLQRDWLELNIHLLDGQHADEMPGAVFLSLWESTLHA